jgi:small-conductance mechanosensitive channel
MGILFSNGISWAIMTAVAVPMENGSVLDDNNPSGNAKINIITSFQFWLSVAILLFGLIVISLQIYLALRKNDDNQLSLDSAIRLSVLTLIIIGSLVLIASGYSNLQVAPVIGLFGTVAGYLIGRQDKQS